MTDSKLYHVLTALTEVQKEKLFRYLYMELQDTNDSRYIVIKQLSDAVQRRNVPADKQEFFTSIFKKVPGSQKMNTIMSESVKLVENFIVTQSVVNDKDSVNLFLGEFYYRHQLNTYFEQSHRKYEAQREDKLSLKGFAVQIETEFLHARYLALNNNRDVNLLSVRQILEEFYSTWKLKLDNIAGVGWMKDNTDIVPENLLFVIHHQLRELFEIREENIYLELFDKIQSNESLIERSELRVIMMLLDNFCINQLNEGKFHFIEHTFLLYQKMIESKVLLDDDDTLLAGQYKNIITIALRTQSFDWAQWFLESFKNNIRDEQAQVVYIFNKANIAFEQKEYVHCLQVLSQVVFKDVFYKLTTKRLMIKSLYMLYLSDRTYFETLHGHLNAFKKYIYTKKNLPEVYQETNKNFYKFIHQIFFATAKGAEDVRVIGTKIRDCEVLADKKWLLHILE